MRAPFLMQPISPVFIIECDRLAKATLDDSV
jgi:hypothetical protein